MTRQLERVLPILTTIPGVDIPAAFLQGLYMAASQRKIEQLEEALRYEVNLLNRRMEAGPLTLDQEYIRSEAFAANVLQALRAAEVAESEDKLRFISRALAGCSLQFPAPQPDKFQTLRIIEGLSDRELRVFVGLFSLLDPLDPFEDRISVNTSATVAGLTRQEFASALLGLGQLGLVVREDGGEGLAWQLTALARQVAALCRIGGSE